MVKYDIISLKIKIIYKYITRIIVNIILKIEITIFPYYFIDKNMFLLSLQQKTCIMLDLKKIMLMKC